MIGIDASYHYEGYNTYLMKELDGRGELDRSDGDRRG